MAKDKKEKREEKTKKGMLKLKPEKKLKKRKAVKEAGVNVAMDESKHGLMVFKDAEGKSGKSEKNTLAAKMKKKKLKDKLMTKLKITSRADKKEQISAKIKETTISPDSEGLKSEKSGKNASAKIKKKKLKDKGMPNLEISSEVDDEEIISANIEKPAVSPGDELGNQEESNSVTKRKLKKGKKKEKDPSSKKQGIHSKSVEQDHEEKKSKESFVMDKENAEEIPLVDEDCSRGMKKNKVRSEPLN